MFGTHGERRSACVILGRNVEVVYAADPAASHILVEGYQLSFRHDADSFDCPAVRHVACATPWEAAEAFVRDLGALPERRLADAVAVYLRPAAPAP